MVQIWLVWQHCDTAQKTAATICWRTPHFHTVFIYTFSLLRNYASHDGDSYSVQILTLFSKTEQQHFPFEGWKLWCFNRFFSDLNNVGNRNYAWVESVRAEMPLCLWSCLARLRWEPPQLSEKRQNFLFVSAPGVGTQPTGLLWSAAVGYASHMQRKKNNQTHGQSGKKISAMENHKRTPH